MRTKDFKTRVFDMWQPLLGYVIASAAVIGLLLFRLRILLPGASEQEVAFQNNSLTAIKSNILYAPFKIAQLVVRKFIDQPVLATRVVSVICAFVVVWLFYYVVRHWFSQRVALLTSWFFVSSAWMLHLARLGDTLILQTAVIGFVAAGIWLKARPHNQLGPLMAGIMAGVMLYIPGFVWPVLLCMILGQKTLRQFIKTSRLFSLAGLVCFGILVAPLIFKLTTNQTLLIQWLGIPEGFTLASLATTPFNMLLVIYNLVWRGPHNPELWLGRLPLLDFLSTILGVLGVYNFAINWRLDRSKTVFGFAIILWVLVGMNILLLPVLLPVCYLFIASGIAFMLQQWFGVFPHNPFARGLVYTLLAAGAVVVGWYNLQHYFVAWPQTPSTKTTFSQRL